jgi:hypothetical protein
MILHETRMAQHRRDQARTVRPRTQAGDDSPRADALVLHLCASVIVPEDADLVQKRSREYFETLKPQNNFHCWCVSEIGLLSIRIDRDERIERRLRDKIVIKAQIHWESDRRLEALRLGDQLGTQPEQVVELLQRTPQGCEWLMGRWAMLAYSADVQNGTWNTQQSDLAFDLLATPALFRPGRMPGLEIDIEGRPVEGSSDPASVARRQIAALKARRDQVEPLDRANRSLAEADLADDTDPELKRLRRHEAMLHSRLRWFAKQLRFQSPEKEPYRGLWRSWLGDHEAAPDVAVAAAPPLPEPKAVVEPEIIYTTPGSKFPSRDPKYDFDLEPDEYSMAGNIPMILAHREDKKLKKAEARRDARRREVEKLRA